MAAAVLNATGAAVASAVASPAINSAATAALKSGTLGISLGGGGFLIFYIFGVLETLVRLGIVTPGVTPIAGTSSGALTTSAFCTGVSVSRIRSSGLSLAYACQVQGNCAGKLGGLVRDLMHRELNASSPTACTGKGFLQITSARLGSPLVGEYSSKSDIVDAAAASSFIPFWSAMAPTTTFRGEQAMDGAVTNNQPCPPGVTYCLRISLEAYEYPSFLNPDLLKLFDQARKAPADQRLSRQVAPLPAKLSYNESRVQEFYAASNLDIAPNVFTPLPWSSAEWNQMLVIPGANNTLQYMHELGVRDGNIWAQRSGMAAAAAAVRATSSATAAAAAAGSSAGSAKQAKSQQGSPRPSLPRKVVMPPAVDTPEAAANNAAGQGQVDGQATP